MEYKNLNVSEIVINTVTEEFQKLLNDDPATYKGYGIIITNEQQFIKQMEEAHKKIYIVVKFLQGSRDFGQQRQPFTITAISEHNSLRVCQQLMMDFAEENNLKFTTVSKSDYSYTLRQTYTTVGNMSNFNEVFDGYRSLFYLSGTFYIGVSSNPITKMYVDDETHSLDPEDWKEGDEHGEPIDFLSAQYSYSAQPDSQPFYGTNNFNRTVAKVATLSIGFSMYSIDSKFYNSAMDIIFNYEGTTTDSVTIDINKKFTVVVKFKNGRTYRVPMKLVSVSGSQEIRDFPASSFTFVR